MRHKLILTLTGEHLLLEVVRPSDTDRSRGLIGALSRLSKSARVGDSQQHVARVEVAIQVTSDLFPTAIEHAWVNLAKIYKPSLVGSEFDVHLGLTHTRLGLLFLAEGTASSTTSSACDTYAKAWVGQMWNIDPATQIIRWQRLDDGRKILISCVDRQVFNGLEAFSGRNKLRFVSCKPALLTALSEHDQQTEASDASESVATTLVWTEASDLARRSSVVQLLRYKGGELQSLWRGWLTPPVSRDGPDEALDGAIRRFLAHNKAQPGDFLRHQHWPARLLGPSTS